VPEFRRKIKEHRNATSLLSGEKYHYYGGYGSQFGSSYKNFIWGTGYGTQSVTGQLVYIDPTVILPLPAYSGLADNQARSMFWKRAQAAQTAFRSFTFLGELTETLHMIRRPGQSLRRGLDDYVKSVTKRTRRAKRSSLNRIVGDTWLEYVFGWAPLISDIQSAGSALNRRLERFQGSYTKISGTGRDEAYTPFVTEVKNQKTSPIIGVDWKIDKRSFWTHRYYGEVQSVCPSPVAADLTLFGVSWKELVPTAWELVPYSFLIDYFTNIGDVLDAWSVRKSSLSWAAQTRRVKVLASSYDHVNRWEPGLAGCVGPDYSVLSCSTAKYIGTKVERFAVSEVSLPDFTWKIPGLGTKWLNMAALAPNINRVRRLLFS